MLSKAWCKLEVSIFDYGSSFFLSKFFFLKYLTSFLYDFHMFFLLPSNNFLSYAFSELLWFLWSKRLSFRMILGFMSLNLSLLYITNSLLQRLYCLDLDELRNWDGFILTGFRFFSKSPKVLFSSSLVNFLASSDYLLKEILFEYKKGEKSIYKSLKCYRFLEKKAIHFKFLIKF